MIFSSEKKRFPSWLTSPIWSWHFSYSPSRFLFVSHFILCIVQAVINLIYITEVSLYIAKIVSLATRQTSCLIYTFLWFITFSSIFSLESAANVTDVTPNCQEGNRLFWWWFLWGGDTPEPSAIIILQWVGSLPTQYWNSLTKRWK